MPAAKWGGVVSEFVLIAIQMDAEAPLGGGHLALPYE